MKVGGKEPHDVIKILTFHLKILSYLEEINEIFYKFCFIKSLTNYLENQETFVIVNFC